MNTHEIAAAIDAIPGARILISNDHSYASHGCWWAQITYKNDSTKIEIDSNGKTLEEAIEKAWTKFESFARYGIPARDLAPQLEAPKVDLDDGIPL